MNVSYDYYRIFYYAARLGSITQAAKLLVNNQPNLTRAIKNLEAELGCRLFLRNNRGIMLTPEGERLYEHIRVAFEHIEAAENEILSNRELKSGVVFVAASEVALRCFLLPLLKKYRAMYPGIRLKIGNYSTPQAMRELSEGLADVAVVTVPALQSAKMPLIASDLIEFDLGTVTENAVCGDAFPELLSGTVTLKQLADYPIISLGDKTRTFELYSDFFSENGLSYTPDIEVATADQILPMVASNLGIGFVPKDFLADYNGAYAIDLAERLPKRKVCFMKRKDRSLSLAAKELERLILES